MLQSQKLQRELASKVKNDQDLRKLFSKVVSNHDETKADAESREDDPEWFQGLDQVKKFVILNMYTCELISVFFY